VGLSGEGDSMMKLMKSGVPTMLGAALAISMTAMAQSAPPTGLPTKDQQKAERQQEKEQEKVVSDDTKAAKAREKSVKARDKAQQKTEKVEAEQSAAAKKE
jgi:hypothetical protein